VVSNRSQCGRHAGADGESRWRQRRPIHGRNETGRPRGRRAENDGVWRRAMTNCLGTRVTVLGVAIITAMTLGLSGAQDQTRSVLVQGPDLRTVAAAVRAVGGEITHDLGIINAVGAQLTRRQLQRLEATHGSFQIHTDRAITVAGQKAGARKRGGKGTKGSKGPKASKGNKRASTARAARESSREGQLGGGKGAGTAAQTRGKSAREAAGAARQGREAVEQGVGQGRASERHQADLLPRPRQRSRTARPADHRSRGHGRRDRFRSVG